LVARGSEKKVRILRAMVRDEPGHLGKALRTVLPPEDSAS
jgi:hypothetical protein